MRSSTSKWLAYTLLVGLIPVLTRLLVSLTTSRSMPLGALYTLTMIGDNVVGIVETQAILVISIALAAIGWGVAIWTMLDARKKAPSGADGDRE
jgi:hypothetical protein